VYELFRENFHPDGLGRRRRRRNIKIETRGHGKTSKV